MPARSASSIFWSRAPLSWKVTKGKWLWNIGGYEYCLFWAICCLVVAMHYR